MTPWKQALERQLSAVGAPAALTLTAIERTAHTARGRRFPKQTLYLWINDASERDRLLPVKRGLYLNRFTSPAGRLADAVPFLRRDAVVSLNTALDEAGVVFLVQGPATVTSLVAHIDYIAKRVGVQHVGIGLDYDPTSGPGLDDATSAKYWPERQHPASIKIDTLAPSALPQVSEQLRALGYKVSGIRAIMSENFMRMASQVCNT
jgi:hypothetical protein